MIYIQKADGLQAISSQLTKEKIIAALGYTPADSATFYEDESGSLVVTDEQGYIIARIGENGLETTQISAKAIQLEGVDLAAKLKSLEEKSVDLTGYATEKYVDEALANLDIDIPEMDLSKYALEADVEANKVITDSHIDSADIHVSVTEKNAWNAKSEFSGNYSDLTGTPNITDPDEEEFVISDSLGNIIMRVNANGLNAAGIYLNGVSINKTTNDLSNKKISILGDSISTYSGYLPSGYATYYPKGNVNNVSKTWWKILIDNNDMVLGQNASYSGSTVQSDTSHSHLNNDNITALSANGVPDIIIIQGGTNDGNFEDLTANGTITETLPTTPLTSQNSYDTTTFSGAYQALIEKVMLAYPNAKICCLGVMWSNNTSYITASEVISANAIIEKLCKMYGCVFLDIRQCGINPVNISNYMIDNLHPNAAGMELIANYIEKCLA